MQYDGQYLTGRTLHLNYHALLYSHVLSIVQPELPQDSVYRTMFRRIKLAYLCGLL
jgi:hypothetical protein